jgi:putative phosphotransacetylase
MNQERLATIIADFISGELGACNRGRNVVPVGISAHHLHLTRSDTDALFGKGYELSYVKPITQPKQFVTNDFVELVGAKGTSVKLRVLGPFREKTQVEITRSDARRLGILPVVRASGDLSGTPGGILRTERGEVRLEHGVIVTDRHLHLSESEAIAFGLSDGDAVDVFVPGDKAGIMKNVRVRAGEGNALDLHIDPDDANAFAIEQGQLLAFERLPLKG